MTIMTPDTMPELTRLSREIHEDNVAKGFYDSETRLFKEGLLQDAVTGGYMNQEDADFIETAVKNQKLMLIVTEVAEACEATRMINGGMANANLTRWALQAHKDNAMSAEEYSTNYKSQTKDRFQAELAGTFIRLMDFCGRYNIDIGLFVEAELAYNRTRAYKHGKTC